MLNCLTQCDTPCNPSSFSDQFLNRFYQQCIRLEKYIASLNSISNSEEKPGKSSQLFHFEPSEKFKNNVQGISAHIIFHIDAVQRANYICITLTNTVLHFSKDLPGKIDHERLSTYFGFQPI
jgi:hypothetical protein